MRIFTLFVVSVLLYSIQTVDPPIWPEVFSQSIIVQFNDATSTVTPGRYWYDSRYNAQRIDYADGKSLFACGIIFP